MTKAGGALFAAAASSVVGVVVVVVAVDAAAVAFVVAYLPVVLKLTKSGCTAVLEDCEESPSLHLRKTVTF
uniref:Uncharacterized protein n=1 Tax=Glossina palpalis gambiensis TaxID=67801 RepID=A0A1B0AWU3_9MUSC